MTILDLAASHLRAGNTIRPKELNDAKEKVVTRGVAEPRGPDKVEISEEAKHLASMANSELDERTDVEKKEDLSENQILEIRRWIDDGFYDLPTTVEEVARLIIESGDLGI